MHESIVKTNSRPHTAAFPFDRSSKDLALAVEEQDDDFQQFSAITLETLDHASGGLSQLLLAQEHLTETSKNHRKMFVVAVALVLILGVHWAFSRLSSEDN